jgi:hypothetical protein
MQRVHIAVLAAAAVLAAGCTTIPTGPSLMALPGTGKDFGHFRADDAECRGYALESVGGTTPMRAQEEAAVRSAVAGALIGGLAGAAINAGSGAAVGAGIGGAAGGLAGFAAGDTSAHIVQRRYDHAYGQCMYAKGHRVPVTDRYSRFFGPIYYPPPTLGYRYPPPQRPSYEYPRDVRPREVPPPPPGTGHPPPPPEYRVPPPR